MTLGDASIESLQIQLRQFEAKAKQAKCNKDMEKALFAAIKIREQIKLFKAQ